jgi:hypothetical protein
VALSSAREGAGGRGGGGGGGGGGAPPRAPPCPGGGPPPPPPCRRWARAAGEHTDWAGSFRRFNSALTTGSTLVVGTNAGLYATARPHPNALVISTTTDKGERFGPSEIPMTPKALLAVAAEGGFFSYAAGVAYKVRAPTGGSRRRQGVGGGEADCSQQPR